MQMYTAHLDLEVKVTHSHVLSYDYSTLSTIINTVHLLDHNILNFIEL